MTSPVKLPPLPKSPESIYFEGEGNEPGELVEMYSKTQMVAYAEQAVREALAAQKPVAWLREVTSGGGVWNRCVSLWEPPTGFIAIDRKFALAIIPEVSDG